MPVQLTANLRRTLASGRLAATRLPLCSEIQLHLISDDYPRGPLPRDEMLAIMEKPAYWAFCWASGQVLARYIFDHPDLVKGQSVLDFGAGSGVVAIAATMAGARRAIACDIDPDALDACVANADLNQVNIELLEDLDALDSQVDWIIAADVLYDRDNLPLLARLPQLGHRVLIGDSRVKDPSLLAHYELLDETHATTIPDLDEQREFNRVRIFEHCSSPRG